MFYIVLYAFLLSVGFAVGFYAGIKNANSSKVAKAKEVLKAIKDE